MRRGREQQRVTSGREGSAKTENNPSFLVIGGEEMDRKAAVHHESSEAFNWKTKTREARARFKRRSTEENHLTLRANCQRHRARCHSHLVVFTL